MTAVTSEIVCVWAPVPRAAAKAVGSPSPITASASIEAFIPAIRWSNVCVPCRRPPIRNEAPRTSSVFPRIEPVMDAVATSSWPARIAKIVMMSSAALPNVAFRTPPTFGPELSPSCSVATPTIHASATSAAPESTKTAVFGASASERPTATAERIAATATDACSKRLRPRFTDREPTGTWPAGVGPLFDVRAHVAELGPPPGAPLLRRDRAQDVELDLDRVGKDLRGLGVIAVGAAGRLRDDRIDDAERQARIGGR